MSSDSAKETLALSHFDTWLRRYLEIDKLLSSGAANISTSVSFEGDITSDDWVKYSLFFYTKVGDKRVTFKSSRMIGKQELKRAARGEEPDNLYWVLHKPEKPGELAFDEFPDLESAVLYMLAVYS